MENIIGFISLVVEGLYFYALTYYLLLEPEAWKVIITKPYKGKPYRIINGYPLILKLLFISALLFGAAGLFIIDLSNDGHHLSFAWFTLSIATVLVGWCLYVAKKSDRGFYVVAFVLIVFSYLLFKGLLMANETACWVVLLAAFYFARFKRKTRKD